MSTKCVRATLPEVISCGQSGARSSLRANQQCVMQVIDAEMARRKLLEESPIPSTNEEPVFFDTAEIPWWAWVRRFHLPEVRRPQLDKVLEEDFQVVLHL